jgi:hypothetical protein
MILERKKETPADQCYSTVLGNGDTGSDSIKGHSLDLEAKSSHAGLVLFNGGLALLLGVIGLREQHAVVAGGLFGLADAAGLE